MNITINTLLSLKQRAEKIAMLTVYDAAFAALMNQTNVDILFIGDSLGNVIQGQTSTIPVTLEEMLYHTRCVVRGNQSKFIISDMPFMSYATLSDALNNGARLMQAGAQMLKIEGGETWLQEIINKMTERGIPICAHLGLTPQSVHKLGGYQKQGTTPHTAEKILQQALALEKAGAQLLVLECIPETLAAEITKNVSIPTIGIGSGPYCDGQVMVIYDILGIHAGKVPRFVKNFMTSQTSILEAIKAYVAAVKNGEFPVATEQGI